MSVTIMRPIIYGYLVSCTYNCKEKNIQMYTCNISLHHIVEIVKAKGVLDWNCRVEVTHFILVTHHPLLACVCVFAHAWPCHSPSSASSACTKESQYNTRSIPSMHTPPLDSILYIRLVEKQGGIESLHSTFGWRANGVIGVTLNREYFLSTSSFKKNRWNLTVSLLSLCGRWCFKGVLFHLHVLFCKAEGILVTFMMKWNKIYCLNELAALFHSIMNIQRYYSS